MAIAACCPFILVLMVNIPIGHIDGLTIHGSRPKLLMENTIHTSRYLLPNNTICRD